LFVVHSKGSDMDLYQVDGHCFTYCEDKAVKV
jgi:hypothetical protein